MIVYFADREMNILHQASTGLPGGVIIEDDSKVADVETGVAVFECAVPFTDETRAKIEACAEAGNYILRSDGEENEFYTIIDAEVDTKAQRITIYAEDAGLDLLNEIVGAYEADKAYNIDHYINKFANDSGFTIGINEVSKLTRQLKWDDETTAAERIASVATQFDGCEISYSFEVKGLAVTAKHINIHKKRGQDIGAQLRLNKEIDRIITKKSIANLATAIVCTGGTPPQTTDIIKEVSSDSGSPKVLYSVSMETRNRSSSAVTLIASVSATLNSESATLGKGYILTASIYVGGSWHSGTIKATDDEWKGDTNHVKEITFTVSGISAGENTFTDIRFKVTRGDTLGGSVGVLSEKSGSKYVVTNYIAGGDNGEGISQRPMTLEGYKYDDGDFYVEGTVLKSRKALERWRRFGLKGTTNKGHIIRTYEYDTLSQSELCARAVTELKKISEMEVNYEVDFTKLPDHVKLGDRVNIIDDAGELYVSARVLKLESSATKKEKKATLGEFLIKGSGISQKVAELAEQFSKLSISAARALTISNNAKAAAEQARAEVDNAVKSVEEAQKAVEEVAEVVEQAKQSAEAAQKAADDAQSVVDSVENRISGLETTVENAQQTANNAQSAANTAQQKANDATQSAAQAIADAADASAAASVAQGAAETATTKADAAQSTADEAKTEAGTAKATADAAKTDAAKANSDIAALGERLDSVTTTMQADYARKTDLTEATASLQTQISQNAAEISSTASRVQSIDETANNAKELAEAAQGTAAAAQAVADQATADAEAAQTAANNAAAAASSAQSEADAAKTAAAAAKNIADKAESDLATAKADLATVASRVDATEEEIASAQEAVEAAQSAADKAKTDAATAAQKATAAQTTADTAVANAATAQTAANDAASKANIAQQTADAAKGDAATAQAKADEAAQIAAAAQSTANTAKTNAANAQAKADQAATDAAAAQQAADDADARAAQAEADLATAQQNLANVTSRVGATEAEVAAAQSAVATAQAAADKAKTDAEAAQSTADTAKANAATAQTAANNAKTAADNAQAAAEAAQEAADEAQTAVDALAVRVTTAETKITQNSEQIALMATKTEVATTLGGYYTKTETDAALTVKANEIAAEVSATYATKEELSTTDSDIRETLVTQQTSILADCEAIILSAVENRVDSDTYEEFKETVSAQFNVLSNSISMNFSTAIEEITKVNGELQAEILERRKHIDFSEDGITIGGSENAITMNLDNDQLVFSKNGVEIVRLDVNNFTPTNVYIKEGGRLRLGNFGFTVREDGSPIFGKVGG